MTRGLRAEFSFCPGENSTHDASGASPVSLRPRRYVWHRATERRDPPRERGIRCPNSVDARIDSTRLAVDVKTSNFQIVPLRTEIAEAARRAAAAGVSDHAVITADSPNGFPCRHCLRWAQLGERMILFPYASIAPGRPYSESGPIFVHAEPCERYAATEQYPADFRGSRVLRAYSSSEDMIDAAVVSDNNPEPVIERLLQNPETAFLQARSVTRGCYTFRIERA